MDTASVVIEWARAAIYLGVAAGVWAYVLAYCLDRFFELVE